MADSPTVMLAPFNTEITRTARFARVLAPALPPGRAARLPPTRRPGSSQPPLPWRRSTALLRQRLCRMPANHDWPAAPLGRWDGLAAPHECCAQTPPSHAAPTPPREYHRQHQNAAAPHSDKAGDDEPARSW